MQFCTECGNKLFEDDKFCRNCGVALAEKQVSCVKCKSNILSGIKHCSYCGFEQKPYEPTLFEYFLSYIKNPINFSGRAKRREFIGFALYTVIFAIVLGFLIGLLSFFLNSVYNVNQDTIAKYFIGMYMLIWVIPTFSAYSRRFHDIGMKFWWVLICFIPEYTSQVFALINPDLVSIFTIEHYFYSNGTTSKLVLNLASVWGALWGIFLILKKGKNGANKYGD